MVTFRYSELYFATVPLVFMRSAIFTDRKRLLFIEVYTIDHYRNAFSCPKFIIMYLGSMACKEYRTVKWVQDSK